MKESNSILEKIHCDTLILRSTSDEIIPYEVGNNIYECLKSENKYLTDISNASHVVLSGNKKEDVSEYIKLFLKGGRKWKKNYKKEI